MAEVSELRIASLAGHVMVFEKARDEPVGSIRRLLAIRVNELEHRIRLVDGDIVLEDDVTNYSDDFNFFVVKNCGRNCQIAMISVQCANRRFP
jgi:hypothetical protein